MEKPRSRPCAGLYDALGDGVLSAGLDAKIIDINDRFSGLVGAERDKLRGSSSASVIRLAFGLSKEQWAALEEGQPQRVRACHTSRKEHELLRIAQPGDEQEPDQVVYVVRDVGYTQQVDTSADQGLYIRDGSQMLRRVYECVARCWADGRPLTLLGIFGEPSGMPLSVFQEILCWAGEEAHAGDLPCSLLDLCVGGARAQAWGWVTLPGVTEASCQDWLSRVWRPGLRDRCSETEIYGASLAEIERAQLPRVETWVMQGVTRVLEQHQVPVRAQTG